MGGALVARALVRLGPTSVTDVPLAIIALTVFASASFVLLLGGGIAYELWTNTRHRRGRTSSFSLGPLAIVALALGTITVSLTAPSSSRD